MLRRDAKRSWEKHWANRTAYSYWLRFSGFDLAQYPFEYYYRDALGEQKHFVVSEYGRLFIGQEATNMLFVTYKCITSKDSETVYIEAKQPLIPW